MNKHLWNRLRPVVALLLVVSLLLLPAYTTAALTHSDNRADFSSDQVFANFRMVTAGKIGEGKLYRVASPINNKINRAATANRLIEAAGVNAIMNMADTKKQIEKYAAKSDFDSQYYMDLYKDGKVIALDLDPEFDTSEFAEGVVKGLTFLSKQDPPYAIHCKKGKDRTGFALVLVEALMGASYQEIVDDYMLSFINFYNLKVGSSTYNAIIKSNLLGQILKVITGTKSKTKLKKMDLASAAYDWLLEEGMSKKDIKKLKKKLK